MNYKIVPVTNSNRYVQYGANCKSVAEIQMWITAVKKEQKKQRDSTRAWGYICKGEVGLEERVGSDDQDMARS